MPFDVKEYRQFVELLYKHPEWRAEVRQLVLSEELLSLPRIVEELAEAQKRTEQRLGALAQRVEELAEAQKRTEQRLDALAQRVEELAEAQKRTEQQVQRLIDRVGYLDSMVLEMTYRDKPSSYFGGLLRRAQAVDMHEIEETLESALSEEEVKEVLRLDLLVRGRLRPSLRPAYEGKDVWLAVEVSVMIDRSDVERARYRAELMKKAGLMAVPMAAGEQFTIGAEELAKEFGVLLQTDGRTWNVEEAMRRLN